MVSSAVQRAAGLGIAIAIALAVLGYLLTSLGSILMILGYANYVLCGFLAATWDKKDLAGNAITGAITGAIIGLFVVVLTIVLALIGGGLAGFPIVAFLIAILIAAAISALGGVVATFVSK